MALLLLERGPAPPSSLGLEASDSCALAEAEAIATGSNEPAGFTEINDTSFIGFTTAIPAINGTAVQGLTRYGSGQGREITDSVAPFSGVGVFRVTIPNGMTQGTGSERIWVGSGSQTLYHVASYTELFLATYVRVDSDYRTPSTATPGTAVQKVFHIWGLSDGNPTGQGGSLVVPAITGLNDSTTAQLHIGIRYQNMSVGGSFNGGTVAINRNQWYYLEVYCKYNTGSAADGICTMYLDGAQRTTLTNLTYKAGGTKLWTTVQLNPTYGGVGTVTGPQYLYYKNWYTSGKA